MHKASSSQDPNHCPSKVEVHTPNSLKVLVIEDEPTTVALLRAILIRRGHKPTICESTEKALALISKTNFPLIILGIKFPETCGLDFCNALRTKEKDQWHYIIIGTAYPTHAILRKIIAAGANDYISKPYDPDLFDLRLAIAEEQICQIVHHRELEQQLSHLAIRDPLTHLLNKAAIIPSIEQVLERVNENNPCVLFFIDLDNLKTINDQFGYAAGDRYIVEFADILRKHTRAVDMLFRFAGDKFVILLNNATPKGASEIAERLREATERFNFSQNDKIVRLSVSIGIAPIAHPDSAHKCLAKADAACFSAKCLGRNRVHYSKETDAALPDLISETGWRSDIRRALRRKTLQIWQQPIIDLANNEIAWRELLVRYCDPETKQIIEPGVFLSVFERTGEMILLDRYVLNQAVKLINDDPNLKLSINISGRSFEEETFIANLINLFTETPNLAKQLIVEITETMLSKNLEAVTQRLAALSRVGVQFAIDDFGKGSSSLFVLREIPARIIKMDCAFVKNLVTDPFNQSVFQAVRDIALPLGYSIVAEGVEDEITANKLRELQIHYAQGFFFEKPKPISQ